MSGFVCPLRGLSGSGDGFNLAIAARTFRAALKNGASISVLAGIFRNRLD
jgi:hypothetical protein